MVSIVELREMKTGDIEESLEDARDEMFNLRFQRASGQLEDVTRITHLRREIARMETVLNDRRRAMAAAAREPAIAAALEGVSWTASAYFDYELSAWVVEFADPDQKRVATAHVNLNKKQILPREKRKLGQAAPRLVIHTEIAG